MNPINPIVAALKAVVAKFSPEPFKMAGTEKTNAFVVVLFSVLGRLGYREYCPGEYRIRVEPFNPAASSRLAQALNSPKWKQPGGGENRFSQTTDSEGLTAALTTAIEALFQDGRDCVVTREAACPNWVKALRLPPMADPTVVEDHYQAVFDEPVLSGKFPFNASGLLTGTTGEPFPPNASGLLTDAVESEADEKARLVKTLQDRKVPGCNAASRWSLATLRSKEAATRTSAS